MRSLSTALLLALSSLVSRAHALSVAGDGGKFGQASSATIDAPVVICPGFGNDSIDYVEPLKQPSEVGLVSALGRRGISRVSVVPVARTDWVRVAGGLFDPNFYLNRALPSGGGYGWYLKRLRAAVDEAYEASGGERVILLGHSAGGWLARAAMGDGTWDAENGVRAAERVRCLATIGAIHQPPEDAGTCVTRGALAYTAENYPGDFLRTEGIGYVSVGGDAIVGNPDKPSADDEQSQADQAYAVRGEGSAARVAFTSYEAVCGEGTVTGDGVVPLEWSRLDGAKHLPLDGVLHSINEAGTTLPTDRWYGADGVVDRWLPAVLEEAGLSVPSKGFGLEELFSSIPFFQR
jgi:pimeloyl-ACP methyl ester carboxylesterase